MDKRILQDHVDEINDIIYDFLPEIDGPNAELAEAVCYSVKAGGKRLRPMLMLETFKFFAPGKPISEVLQSFMAAIEFVHTYSLIHDDLPAMDNDEYRRGQLTTHAKYGEAFGVLAGDALLNYAFETVLKFIDESDEPDDYMCGISAARLLSEKAGLSGMVGGQSVDVYSDKHPDFVVDEPTLNYIFENKTCALIEAAMMIGAIFGLASDIEIKVIEKMASYIGYAFQIQDDILDVIGSQEVLGKPIGSDEKNGKVTYVTLYGLENAKKAVKEYTEKALEIFDKINHKNAFLRELIIELIERDK